MVGANRSAGFGLQMQYHPPDSIFIKALHPLVVCILLRPHQMEEEKSGESTGGEQLEVLEQLRESKKLLEKAVSSKDARLAGRALRQALAMRKRASASDLMSVTEEFVSSNSLRSALQLALQQAPQASVEAHAGTDASMRVDIPVECGALAAVLTVAFLVDSAAPEKAAQASAACVHELSRTNRRTLDQINARLLQLHSLAHEHCNKLESIRNELMKLYRTSVLRHDSCGQEVLINLILRNFLKHSQFEQAEKFRTKAQRPEAQSNQQACRYLFYLGQIQAVRLEYSDAKDSLGQALRKAPQVAKGFRLASVKWLAVVRLLLGEIPERSLFMHPGMRSALKPYYDIANAVRLGDVVGFEEMANAHASALESDGLLNLVKRLHRNVVRVGLRRINLAYSRIALSDIASKLQLRSHEEAENIVGKAIKDGAVEATIDPHGQYMQSLPPVDVYSTSEPQSAFHARIAYCLNLHNEAVQAMRFPRFRRGPKAESHEQRRERAVAEEEIMQMEDGDLDDDLI